jgi:P-type Cu+ transporter
MARRCLPAIRALLEQYGIAAPKLPVEAGATALHIAHAGTYVGTLLCRDAVREDAVSALRPLRELDLKPIMLTGDTVAAAQPLAESLGIREVYAGLSPEQKLERIRELQRRGARVLMVGDGINDAAAIAQADSGIGMGTAPSSRARQETPSCCTAIFRPWWQP